MVAEVVRLGVGGKPVGPEQVAETTNPRQALRGTLPQGEGLAARGFELFRRKGCSGCHAAGSSVHAPDLAGVYGRVVHLADGRSVVADEGYLRDSILLPKRDVVAGYEPIMPSYQGQLDEEELFALISYLKAAK